MFSKILTKKSTRACSDESEKKGSATQRTSERAFATEEDASAALSPELQQLKTALAAADAVIIGAGAGLSTSAGFDYVGSRFHRYFADFRDQYGIRDMYSGGFYPYRTLEEYWGFWSRYIWINRYQNPPKPVYENLLELVKGKDYFVLTTNVDHCFQKAGFDKHRLFYTQGDYGLLQCMDPCHQNTYDNKDLVRQMVESQGFQVGEGNELMFPGEENLPSSSNEVGTDGEGATVRMTVSSDLVPRCPRCGRPMTMNLRADGSFVEDQGWHQAAERYSEFLRRHDGQKILFLELGVGGNTPVIIKYPFWKMTAANPDATYACINRGEAVCPRDIAKQSICIDGDIGEVLESLR